MSKKGTLDKALKGLCIWSVMAVFSGSKGSNATRIRKGYGPNGGQLNECARF
jgi:hypothetical protein